MLRIVVIGTHAASFVVCELALHGVVIPAVFVKKHGSGAPKAVPGRGI
jgi:hypothetical protein